MTSRYKRHPAIKSITSTDHRTTEIATDPLDIPQALLRHDPKVSVHDALKSRPSEGDADYVDPRYRFAEPNPNRDSSLWLKPVGLSADEWADIQARKATESAARKSASFAKFKRKLEAKDSMPTDINGRPLYALPSKNVTKSGVFVEGGTRVKFTTGRVAHVTPGGLGPAAQQVPKSKSKGSVDDLGAQVSDRVGTDMNKMKAFAALNGVWKDGDQNAKNFGLLRMTVVNRLRGRLRRGEIKQVEWP